MLERLDRGFAQSIVLRLSRVPSLDQTMSSARIQGAIERDFLSVLQRNLSKRRPGRPDRRPDEQHLLRGARRRSSAISRRRSPALAQDVQRTMFTFEDIAARLSAARHRDVLRDVPEDSLLAALKLGETQASATVGLRPRERAAPPRRALRRRHRGHARRQPQGGRGRADRGHEGDPGHGARGAIRFVEKDEWPPLPAERRPRAAPCSAARPCQRARRAHSVARGLGGRAGWQSMDGSRRTGPSCCCWRWSRSRSSGCCCRSTARCSGR